MSADTVYQTISLQCVAQLA